MASKDQARPPKKPRSAESASPERIVDAALELADEDGWSNVRMSAVAARLGVPTAGVLGHFRDKDAVADAFFGRGWRAMLAEAPEGFADLPAKQRLDLLLMRWFDALAPHRAVAGQMLKDKLYPSHPHHWVPLVFNLSRTIQWLRDAALLEAGGRRRQVEEVGLTLLFLAVLRFWVTDESPGQEMTRAELSRRLDQADRLMVRLYGRKSAGPEPEQAGGTRPEKA